MNKKNERMYARKRSSQVIRSGKCGRPDSIINLSLRKNHAYPNESKMVVAHGMSEWEKPL